MANDPIHQFVVEPIFPLPPIAGMDFSFTNASAYMMLTVAVAAGFMIFAASKRQVVPGRTQLIAELLYQSLANLVISSIGKEGMRFFPLVFSLFSFILVANLIGMFPYAFTVTAQIVVTAALALLVFAIVTVYGLWRHGLKFFRLFMPSGLPGYLAPIVVPIEIVFLHVPAYQPLGSPLRGDACRAHHFEGIRGLRRRLERHRPLRCLGGHSAIRHGCRDHCFGVVDVSHPGIRFHHADLYVFKRCGSSFPLTLRFGSSSGRSD